MNSETAIVIAIVISVIIILSVATAFSGTLSEAGSSVFGENSEDSGLFEPDKEGERYDFPDTSDSETSDGILEGVKFASV